MKCPICNIEMVEANPTHTTEDSIGIFRGDTCFPLYLLHIVKFHNICPKCRGEVIRPETKYYYPKEK